MVDPKNFTYKSQESLALAFELANESGHTQLEDLHLLKALLNDQQSIVYQTLEQLLHQTGNKAIADITAQLDSELEKLPATDHSTEPTPSHSLIEILNVAEQKAKELGDAYLSREHLLLAIILTDCQSSSILKKHGVTTAKVKEVIMSIRGNQKITDKNPEEKYQVLEKYT